MKFVPMNRHQRRALARAGKTIDVRIEDGDHVLANTQVVILSSPEGDATAFSCNANNQEEAVRHATIIAGVVLAPRPEEEAQGLSRPSETELVAALSRVDAEVCWVTYIAWDGAGNMRMRQERRKRMVLS